MKLLRHSLNSFYSSLEERELVYSGVDAAATLQVKHGIEKVLEASPDAQRAFAFSSALQGPVLDMMLRGVLVDSFQLQSAVHELRQAKVKLQHQLDTLARAVWGAPLNPNSPKQLAAFFYKALNLPEIKLSFKGVYRVSTGKEALKRLKAFSVARPFVLHVEALRDITKQLSVLTTPIDSDSRARCSYNIGGTKTWRFSSSASCFGTGYNFQNIDPRLRRVFVSDPGWKLCYADLEQAEPRFVGAIVYDLFGDPTYLDACESGDLHTTVTGLIWNHITNREEADQILTGHLSYRDFAKKGSNGTNYVGQAATIARHVNAPVQLVEAFQAAYFARFPGIRRWHQQRAYQLETTHCITSFTGFRRRFFDRPWEPETIRSAVAFDPQNSCATTLNMGLLRLWKSATPGGPEYEFLPVQILAQVHDAILFQYPEECEAKVLERARELMTIKYQVRGREFFVPVDFAVGWNWGKYDEDHPEKNPDGMRKWKGSDERRRLDSPEAELLSRRVHRFLR